MLDESYVIGDTIYSLQQPEPISKQPAMDACGVLDVCNAYATAYAVEHALSLAFSTLDESYVIGDTIYSLQEPEPDGAILEMYEKLEKCGLTSSRAGARGDGRGTRAWASGGGARAEYGSAGRVRVLRGPRGVVVRDHLLHFVQGLKLQGRSGLQLSMRTLPPPSFSKQ